MEKGPLTTAERNRLIKLLNDVGLDDSEAAVYMAALGVGSRPASVIAQKAKLKRGQTYNVLNSLTEKGIVQQVEKNGVKHFSCSSPKALVGMLEAKERELAEKRLQLERAIPELEKLINPNINQPRVRYFQGIEGLKAVYDGILSEPITEFFTISDVPLFWSESKEERIAYFRSFIARREKLGITWYGICVPSAEALEQEQLCPSPLRKIKWWDQQGMAANYWLFGDKLAVTSKEQEQIGGVIIENRIVANTFKLIFDFMWNKL